MRNLNFKSKAFSTISLLLLLLVVSASIVIAQDDSGSVFVPLVSNNDNSPQSSTSTPKLTATESAPTNTPTAFLTLTATNTPAPTSTEIDTATSTATPTPTNTPIAYDEMVLVPAGNFEMGCDPSDREQGCRFIDYADQTPLHTIYLDAYYIDKFEVTNGRYKKCVEAGVCTDPAEEFSSTRSLYYSDLAFINHPVTNVDWNQADNFCRWEGKHLPTEAEWEKAARGSEDVRLYPWGNSRPEPGYTYPNTSDAVEVGSYPEGASPYGVMDLVGNVSEWVDDWYYYDYYSRSPYTNPRGGSESFPFCSYNRTHRGSSSGMWDLNLFRLAYRFYNPPETSSASLGFRCARPIDDSTLEPIPSPTPVPAACSTITGVIDEDTTLDGSCEYSIPESILVEENTTLTIPAGTVLRFDWGAYLKVDGALVTQGTEEAPVTFTASNDCSQWKGIRITEKSGSSSSLEYTIIEHGIGDEALTGHQVLDVENAQPALSHITFRYNQFPLSLDAGEGYTATVESSTFISNTGYSNVFLGFGKNIIKDSLFEGNSGTMTIRTCPGNSMENNIFVNNLNGTVIWLNGCSSDGPTIISQNTISSNRGIAIAAERNFVTDPVAIMNNHFEDNRDIVSLNNWCSSVITHNRHYID